MTISNAGGTATASFSGTANQRVSLNFSSVTITSSSVSIRKPDGTNLVSSFTVTKSGYYWDVHTLPATGTYKIVIDAKSDYTGSMKLRLYDVPPDFTGPITADGTSATVTTTTPGQNAALTFSGTAGQRVSVDLSGVTYKAAKLKIFNPDSTPLFSTALSFSTGGGFLEPKTLPATGSYTLVVDPTLLYTGQATVQLYTVPADFSSAITADGSAVTATTTVPGQNAHLTFTGSLNQRVSLELSGSTYGAAKVSLIKQPEGTLVFSPSKAISPLGTFVEPVTLPAAGNYEVFVDPQLADTGSVDVKVHTVPADVSGAITPGTTVPLTIAAPGQNAYYTFSGTAGQRVSLKLANSTVDLAKAWIYRKDSPTVKSSTVTVTSAGDAFLEPWKLPATATYKVAIDPQGTATGTMDVTLYNVPADKAGSILPNASPVTITNDVPGQNALLTFTLTSSKRVSLKVESVTMASAPSTGLKLTISNPDGSTLTSKTLGTDGTFIDTQSLTQTGTYKILLNPDGAVTGSATLTLYTVPADVTVPIVANGTPTPVTVGTPGQNAVLTFSASANQRVALEVSGVTAGTPKVWLEKAGTSPVVYVFYKQTVNADPFWFDTKSVGTSSGTFRIVFDPQGASTGGATFKLWTVPSDSAGTMTAGTAKTVNVTTPGQNAIVTFTATAGWTATVTFNSGTIAQAWAKLYGPTGTQIGSAYWDPTITNDTVQAVLPATGTYSFLLDPEKALTGSETFTLTLSPPA